MLKHLLRLIMKHIPISTMLYKACLTYKDPILQQDWISTMYQHVNPEFHSEIEKLKGYTIQERRK